MDEAKSDNADSSPRAPALPMRTGAMRAAVWLYVVLGLVAEAVEDESSNEASSEDAIMKARRKQQRNSASALTADNLYLTRYTPKDISSQIQVSSSGKRDCV